jgi:glucose-1-phosphate thymidylyltransferase
MHAIILAAGFCTRLFPITENFPKALLTIGGREILRNLLDDLESVSEINKIVLITNGRYSEIFTNWLGTNYNKLNIEVINNKVMQPNDRLGAIGDLLFGLKAINNTTDTMVLASDTLTSLNLKDFTEYFHQQSGIVNAVFDTKGKEIIRSKLGCVEVKDERIMAFTEKPVEPKTTLTSIPYYIFPKEVLPLVKKYPETGLSLDAPGSLIQWLVTQTPCFAYQLNNGYYYDVGTIDVLNELNRKGVVV